MLVIIKPVLMHMDVDASRWTKSVVQCGCLGYWRGDGDLLPRRVDADAAGPEGGMQGEAGAG